MIPVRPTFDEVLTSYQDSLYRYALHLTGHRMAADAVYQETVLAVYHAFDPLDESASHRAWLYRIATNAFLRNRRKGSKEGSLVEESTELVPVATGARCEARGLLQEVEAFVGRLPLAQRSALILRKYHDLSYAEIAASLRCSEATVPLGSIRRCAYCGPLLGSSCEH